ncbi:hypothetical protein ABZ897_51150 [Nonomuraea sp. NPDC046802]
MTGPDVAAPMTIWHGELDDDSRCWLTQASQEIEQFLPAGWAIDNEGR